MWKENIVLCGFMGSGKTTVGAILAQKLEASFVDMDEYIEKIAGRTVAGIFADEGEEGFRRREHEACRALTRQKGQVIAAGGGALLFPRNQELFEGNSVILFLDTTLGEIQNRLKTDTTRPLLARPDRESETERLYALRRPQYIHISHHTIPADDVPGRVADSILQWLREQKYCV